MAKLAGRGERIPVSIDGPYGDAFTAQKLAEKEKVVLIAGGSGAGYLLPLLERLVRQPRTGGSDVKVVIAVRHYETVGWAMEAIERILSVQKEDASGVGKISVEIHVTDDVPAAPKAVVQDNASSSSADAIHSTATDIEKNGTNTKTRTYSASSQKGIAVIEGKGRPDLKALIKNSATGQRVGVTACGPASMMLDVRNACAEAQRGIIARKIRGELWLHTESFSW